MKERKRAIARLVKRLIDPTTTPSEAEELQKRIAFLSGLA